MSLNLKRVQRESTSTKEEEIDPMKRKSQSARKRENDVLAKEKAIQKSNLK